MSFSVAAVPDPVRDGVRPSHWIGVGENHHLEKITGKPAGKVVFQVATNPAAMLSFS